MSELDTGLDDELPVPLKTACARYFAGALTPSALRTENRKGNLEIIRIAKKDFVTGAAIKRMILKCRVEQKPRDSGFGQTQEHGSSRTAPAVSPQNALSTMLNGPKPPCKRTSQPNTDHQDRVVPISSQSRTR
jgi:hypothetical protein